MPASSAASSARRASGSSEPTAFMKPCDSPMVIAPSDRALTRRPDLPNCLCSTLLLLAGVRPASPPLRVRLALVCYVVPEMPRTPNPVLPFEDQATQAVAQPLRPVSTPFQPPLRVP